MAYCNETLVNKTIMGFTPLTYDKGEYILLFMQEIWNQFFEIQQVNHNFSVGLNISQRQLNA